MLKKSSRSVLGLEKYPLKMGPRRLTAQQGFQLSQHGEARTQLQAMVGSGGCVAPVCPALPGVAIRSCSWAGAVAPRPPSCPVSLWPRLLCHGTGETSPNPLPTSVHLLYVLFFPSCQQGRQCVFLTFEGMIYKQPLIRLLTSFFIV